MVVVSRRGRVLWPDCRIAGTAFERMRGIMFSPERFPPLLIRFNSQGRKRNALHSFFCPPFDAVFIDASGRVVDVLAPAPKNSAFVVPRQAYESVIELAAGEAGRNSVAVGDVLVLE